MKLNFSNFRMKFDLLKKFKINSSDIRLYSLSNFRNQNKLDTMVQPLKQDYKLVTRLIKMRVVKNMTVNGKIAKFSAIVVAGNGNGGLGCGDSKHNSAQEAVLKAGKLAIKNMEYFERWQNRTLFHDDFFKFKATKLYVRPSRPSN
jgi:ribosomal protein S5